MVATVVFDELHTPPGGVPTRPVRLPRSSVVTPVMVGDGRTVIEKVALQPNGPVYVTSATPGLPAPVTTPVVLLTEICDVLVVDQVPPGTSAVRVVDPVTQMGLAPEMTGVGRSGMMTSAERRHVADEYTVQRTTNSVPNNPMMSVSGWLGRVN